MKLVNSTKRDNPLMKRVQYVVELDAEKTPSRKETREFLSKELKIKKDTLVLRKLEGKFGSRKVLATVYSYENEEYMNKIEEKYIIERNKDVVEVKEE
ncbi:MAG: hypothetical protein PHT94_02295 [Candidatus Nanoarchaeia archaeon]|nr:hypothetical protein [Candidatus Nanoarchaeia archaeon]